jgi:hypothetical protein
MTKQYTAVDIRALALIVKYPAERDAITAYADLLEAQERAYQTECVLSNDDHHEAEVAAPLMARITEPEKQLAAVPLVYPSKQGSVISNRVLFKL